jgi:hypothetical protein
VIAGMNPASLSFDSKAATGLEKNLSEKIRVHPDSLRIRS